MLEHILCGMIMHCLESCQNLIKLQDYFFSPLFIKKVSLKIFQNISQSVLQGVLMKWWVWVGNHLIVINSLLNNHWNQLCNLFFTLQQAAKWVLLLVAIIFKCKNSTWVPSPSTFEHLDLGKVSSFPRSSQNHH